VDVLQDIQQLCPYCGERISLLIDSSAGSQHYIEDCQVCCQPMVVLVTVDQQGGVTVSLNDENSVT
jgi:hypothetical protein